MNDTFWQTDVVVVGAGPVGLELAVALKQAGIEYLQFEAGQIGHTISWWPRNTRFFSSPERIGIAGVPLQTVDQEHATGEQYLAYLRSVAMQFNLEVNAYEPVERIERWKDGFRVHTRHRLGKAQLYLPAGGPGYRRLKRTQPLEYPWGRPAPCDSLF
jgi:thioredoxin reductase (NADPH)